jgi:hypothetical protein
MAQNIYVCLECREVTTNEGLPPIQHCKKNGLHRWRNLGEPGSQRFHCKKCGITVHVNSKPASSACPVSAQHDWEKI